MIVIITCCTYHKGGITDNNKISYKLTLKEISPALEISVQNNKLQQKH